MASITVRFVDGRNTRASRLCIPQSRLAEPLRVYGCGRAGTDAANRTPSLRLSLSAMMVFFRLWTLGGRSGLRSGGPPERVEQAFLRETEHPRVDLAPGRIAPLVGGHGARVGLEHGRAGAQLAFEVGQAGVHPGAPAGAQRGAQRAALGHGRDADRQPEHVRDDLRPELALAAPAGEGQRGDADAAELADDLEMAADNVGGRLLDRADAGRPAGARWVVHVELEEGRARVHPPAGIHQVRQDGDDAVRARRDPRRRLLHDDVRVHAAAARLRDLAVAEGLPVPAHGHAAVEPDALEHPFARPDVAQRAEPDAPADERLVPRARARPRVPR